MPAMSSGNQAVWRSATEWVNVYAWLHAPATVLKARLNMASISYPIEYVDIDTISVGSYGDIAEFQVVLFGSSDGADDLGRAIVVRADDGTIATSSRIYINRCSQGKRDSELDLVNDSYVTVINMRPIWAIPPRIDEDTEITYKWGRLSFNEDTCYPPVVAMGGDVLRIVNSNLDTATVDFDQSFDDTATNPDHVGSLTYAWDFGDGTPSTSTSAKPTGVSFPYGVRYIQKTVTDSLGTAWTSWRLVAVVTADDCLQSYEISNWAGRAEGQTVTLKINDSIPANTYPNGTELLIYQEEVHDNVVANLIGATDREGMVFCGWHQAEPSHTGQATARGYITSSTLMFVDAARRLDTLPGFPETLSREADPTRWEQRKGLNVDRFVHSILQWSSNVFSRADFAWSGTGETYAFPELGSDGKAIYAQSDGRTQAIRYKLTCDIGGRLAMKGDPQVLPTSTQASTYSLPTQRTTTTQIPLQASDVEKREFAYEFASRVHWLWGESIMAEATDAEDVAEFTTYFCVAPGKTPGQGVSAQSSGEQVTVSQNELNVVEGNRIAARMNNTIPSLRLLLTRMGRAIDPALMEWVEDTIDSDVAAPRSRTYTSQKFLPIEVSYRYNLQAGTCRQEWTLEREVQGVPAETYYPPDPTESVLPPSYPPITFPPAVPVSRIPEWTGRLPIKMFILSYSESKAAKATSMTSSGTITWTDISTGLSGTGIWARSDPYNYFRRFALTTSGLYVCDDIWASSPSWSQRATNTAMFGDSARRGYKLLMSHMVKGWIMALSGDTGAAVSFDYGYNWSQVSIKGGSPSWGTSAARGGDVEICGRDANHLYSLVQASHVSYHDVYKSEDGGLTWSATGGQAVNGGGLTSAMCLHIPYSKAGGAANEDDGNLHIYTIAHSSGPQAALQKSTNGGTSFSTVVADGGYVETAHSYIGNPFVAFTHDADYWFFAGLHEGSTATYINKTANDFSTWSSPFNDNGQYGQMVNGWSMNPDAAITFNLYGGVYVTLDGFATWFGNMPTGWANGVAYAEFDLSDFISARG